MRNDGNDASEAPALAVRPLEMKQRCGSQFFLEFREPPPQNLALTEPYRDE